MLNHYFIYVHISITAPDFTTSNDKIMKHNIFFLSNKYKTPNVANFKIENHDQLSKFYRFKYLTFSLTIKNI